MRALALLLLFAAAASTAYAYDCPSSMHPADAADREALDWVGKSAFRTHIHEFCDQMPVYVTDRWYFDASIVPVCTDDARHIVVFEVQFKSPCNNNEMTTVHMTVDTRPEDCNKIYDPKLAKWGWYTKVPGNMRPLQCPAGFRKAGKRDLDLLQAFVNEEFLQNSLAELKDKEGKHPRYYCKGGIMSLKYWYLNGCVQIWPKNVSPYIMAQGKVDYVCYGTNTVRRLGLDGEGLYRTKCAHKVTFDA